MTRAERDLAHVAFYEARGRVGAFRHRHEAQVEFLSAYDEEYESPQGTRIPRRSKLPDFWPVPACIAAALAIRYPREAALVFLFSLGIVGASLAVAYVYYGCKRAWPDIRAFVRRLPETAVDCLLIVGAAIEFVCRLLARDARLWALSWRVVLMASVEMAGMPPLPHHEAPPEAIAFELDLANPEAFTAVAPF